MSTTLLKHNHVFSIVSSYVQSNCSEHRRDLQSIIVEIPGGKAVFGIIIKYMNFWNKIATDC